MNVRDKPALEVQGLAVQYGHVSALRDLSFSIRDGECFALVGESGSGKSTALRAIAGLAPVSAGKIFHGGQEIVAKRDAAFYRSVQMVFQDPYGALHPRQTIERQLLEPLHIHGFDDKHARVRKMVSLVGLTDRFLYRFPHQLSGGQRQRVVIARALLMEPRVLLLDEPTSALDVSIQAEILNLLMDLHDEFGLTYLLVSHDLAVVATMCTRLLVMKEGLAVEELSAQQLREGHAETSYARALFRASLGYVGQSSEQV